MSPALTLDDIRPCLEGHIPAMIATVASDGTPNVAYLSQVYYVDPRHVALSFQFFNKTRKNILSRPEAALLLLDPQTFAFYRLQLRYLHTRTEGPLFESMRAQLAGIASHEGMADVFELKGSDIYGVQTIEAVPGPTLPAPPPRCALLGPVRRCSEQLARASTLDETLANLMQTLAQELGIAHALVLLLDPAQQRLYTVSSLGYPQSGVGSEIELGHGVIGMSAQARTPVRISHMTSASLYNHTVRRTLGDQSGPSPSTDIPYPGLAQPQSQMAVPLLSADRLLGVLFVESPQEMRFSFQDEDALVTLAGQLATTIELLRQTPADSSQAESATPHAPPAPQAQGRVQVRRYRSNHSIFLDSQYLIKGVAGAICWKLLQDYQQQGRSEFSNRELRLDSSIGLPEVVDNLEARLILLERRLAEQSAPIRIVKTGRGRFQLQVGVRLELVEAD